DVLLAAAVNRDEVDKEVLREARLEVLETLQLGRAGGAPGGAEAQDHDLPAERLRAHRPPRQIGKRERGRRSALGKDEDGRILRDAQRSEEHTSELQSRGHLVCRLLLEKKKHEMIKLTQHYPTDR